MAAGRIVGTGIALAAIFGASIPAIAGGHGCRGKAVACYEKVRLPDVYKTIERPVVVKPAREHVVRVPAVVGTRLEREIVAPGRVHAVPVAPVYGTLMRREMVAPGTVSYRSTPDRKSVV